MSTVSIHVRPTAAHVSLLRQIAQRQRIVPSNNELSTVLLQEAIEREGERLGLRLDGAPATTAAMPAKRSLKDLREAAGLTQPALATHVGLSRDQINRIEHGAAIPKSDGGDKLRAWMMDRAGL